MWLDLWEELQKSNNSIKLDYSIKFNINWMAAMELSNKKRVYLMNNHKDIYQNEAKTMAS